MKEARGVCAGGEKELPTMDLLMCFEEQQERRSNAEQQIH